LRGGEVEEDNGRDNSGTAEKIKTMVETIQELLKKLRQNALDFGLHIQPYMLPTKGTNCTEVYRSCL
jgi:uncharacterized FlaG/YvyC family protein